MAGAKSSRARVRSFGGCLTCRNRKVKCDEVRPICGQCRRSSLVCGGYEAKIRFVYDADGSAPVEHAGQGRSGGHARRILFTVQERAAMSWQMQLSVNENEVDQVIRDLDSRHRRNGQAGGTPRQGPFSVFEARALDEPAEPSPSPASQSLNTSGDPHLSDLQHNIDPLLLAPAPDRTQPGQPLAELIESSTLELAPLEGFTAQVVVDDEIQVVTQEPTSLAIIPQSSQPNHELTMSSPLLNLHIGSATTGEVDDSIFPQAHFLLEHYRSQTGKLFSPLRVRKSAWSVLHFPRALAALSELSIFKKAKHANTSLFYSILAVSAFNWDNIHCDEKGSSTFWRSVGEGFRRRARRELEWTCETELVGEASSKYKDILIAVLTMVTISVVTGQQQEARSFLLNAEVFICLRGIPKVEKSRKVKLLHSIYLFLRVIEESTYIYPQERPQLVTPSLPLNAMRFPSLRTHRLCLGRDLDVFCGTDFEAGLFGGPDSSNSQKRAAIFEEVYGFPEELFSFISRATYLANEVFMFQNQFPGFSVTSELEDRCRQLENEICAWIPPASGLGRDGDEDPVSTFANKNIMPHLVVAFHCAVVIFFYRRVRHLNPLVLQTHVEKTIANMEGFEQEQRNFSLVNCGVVWPGGMRNFDLAADLLRDLWELRRQNPNITWMDLVRDRRLSLVLT
ncbi:hypothetical protein ACJZ2D_003834 [Fusarium nematophilum]